MIIVTAMDEEAIFKNRLILDDKSLRRLSTSCLSIQQSDSVVTASSIETYLLELDNVQLSLERFYRTQSSLMQERDQLVAQAKELEQQKQTVQEEMNLELQLIEQDKQIIEMKRDLDAIATEIQKLPSLSTLHGHYQTLEADIQEIQANLNASRMYNQEIIQQYIEPQLYQLQRLYDIVLPAAQTDDTSIQ